MSGNNLIASRYYPQLSDLIMVDDLPDFLDFAKDGIHLYTCTSVYLPIRI
jgi:hypothetical protein